MKKPSLKDTIVKLVEENRIDDILQILVKILSWDDILLAFSNVCVFSANKDKAENKKWIQKAIHFHEAIIDQKKATVQARKIT